MDQKLFEGEEPGGEAALALEASDARPTADPPAALDGLRRVPADTTPASYAVSSPTSDDVTATARAAVLLHVKTRGTSSRQALLEWFANQHYALPSTITLDVIAMSLARNLAYDHRQDLFRLRSLAHASVATLADVTLVSCLVSVPKPDAEQRKRLLFGHIREVVRGRLLKDWVVCIALRGTLRVRCELSWRCGRCLAFSATAMV
jgi:hypothetical protein